MQKSHPSTSKVKLHESEDNLVAIRVLGHCMRETESLEGLIALERTIRSSGDSSLFAIGEFYLRNYPDLYSQDSAGPNSSPSDYHSPPSANQHRQTYLSSMEQGSLSRSQAKGLALERGNYRCCVAGAYDTKYEVPDRTAYVKVTGQPTLRTNATHIIPEYLNNFPLRITK
ncbi:hypothetical protein B0H10DRAFT_2441046 [Mycena sp. CBHHK59/15]|nr:hypothetical protein B0H10DRAFT_2441046 [Mycena sp. CBHHK59/15]